MCACALYGPNIGYKWVYPHHNTIFNWALIPIYVYIHIIYIVYIYIYLPIDFRWRSLSDIPEESMRIANCTIFSLSIRVVHCKVARAICQFHLKTRVRKLPGWNGLLWRSIEEDKGDLQIFTTQHEGDRLYVMQFLSTLPPILNWCLLLLLLWLCVSLATRRKNLVKWTGFCSTKCCQQCCWNLLPPPIRNGSMVHSYNHSGTVNPSDEQQQQQQQQQQQTCQSQL